MRSVIKLSGFILVGIGTLGLLITELVSDWGNAGSPNFTLIFAAVNVVGLAILAFAHWGMRQDI